MVDSVNSKTNRQNLNKFYIVCINVLNNSRYTPPKSLRGLKENRKLKFYKGSFT